MSEFDDPMQFPWDEVNDLRRFRSKEWTKRILNGLSVYNNGTKMVNPKRQKQVERYLRKYSQPILDRLATLENQLNEMFIAKQEIIRMVIVCAIAQQPMLLVGPPGTAKSKIITRFCEGLGISRIGEKGIKVDPDYQVYQGLGISRIGEKGSEQTSFQYLLHSFTEPDEILGPVNLEMLRAKEPRFERFREGSITNADVIFLDEVFKANSAILNALLTIINERRVFEGGIAHRTKARLIYGASNLPPTPRQLEELRAFYERFIIRMESCLIPTEFNPSKGEIPQNRRDLLARGWESETQDLRFGYDPVEASLDPVACLNDILFCNRAITEFWGAEDLNNEYIQGILPLYHRLVINLTGGMTPICTIDDRKFIRLFLIIRAYALYEHNGPPNIRDLCVLRHIWNDLEGKELVAHAVNDFINKNSVGDSGS